MPLSTRRIFALWRQRNDLKAKVARLNEMVQRRDKAILAELERRGVKSLTDKETGERINYSQAEPLVFYPDKIKTHPYFRRTKKGREVLQRCTVEVIDLSAIASEHKAGNLPAEVVAACSEIKKSAPYLTGGGGRGE